MKNGVTVYFDPATDELVFTGPNGTVRVNRSELKAMDISFSMQAFDYGRTKKEVQGQRDAPARSSCHPQDTN